MVLVAERLRTDDYTISLQMTLSFTCRRSRNDRAHLFYPLHAGILVLQGRANQRADTALWLEGQEK